MHVLRPTNSTTGLQAQFAAGLSAAMVVIPLSIGMGIFALSPLARGSPGLVAQGAWAGLLVVALGTAIALGAWLVRRRGMPLVFAPGSMVAYLVGASTLQAIGDGNLSASLALGCLALITAGAGLLQIVFGVLRMGNLAKYVPHPVIAGFQNAAALLLLFGQVALITGTGIAGWIRTPSTALVDTPLLALLVAAVTFAGCWLSQSWAASGRHWLPAVPAGIVAGALAHHALATIGQSAALGPMVGAFTGVAAPGESGAWITIAATLRDPALPALLPALGLAALSVALLASLDTLLCAKVIENNDRRRMNGNGLLLRTGMVNACGGFAGGIPVSVNLASNIAAQRAGGLGAVGLAVCCALCLVTLALSGPLFDALPQAAVGGALAFIALQVVDRWTMKALSRFVRGIQGARARLAIDLAIVAVVCVITLVADPILAVGIGLLIALAGFVLQMSRSVVRRTYDASQVGSRKTRPARTARILVQHGQRIRIFELRGPMFFGTAEQLSDLLDDSMRSTIRFVVLDLNRVTDVDSTAAQVLARLAARLDGAGVRLALAGFAARTVLSEALERHGVLAGFASGRVFADTDRAIEWAEDALIMEELSAVGLPAETDLSQVELFRGLDADAAARLQAAMTRREFASGQIVFGEGDPGDALYVIVRGTASVRVATAPGIDPDLPASEASARRSAAAAPDLRLITFSPGTVFGELALFDRERRSATVQADEPLVCYALSTETLEQLRREHPLVALALLGNLGRTLADRLRRTNRAIEHLAG